MDGRFPTCSMGIPEGWSTLFVTCTAFFILMITTLLAGLGIGVYLLVAWFWVLGQVRRRLVVQKSGVFVGPPWTPLTPWHRIERVTYSVKGARAFVRFRSDRVGGECVVPTVLIPAIRGRLWRLGGIKLKEAEATSTDRYLQWASASWVLTWLILLSASTTVWFFDEPWSWLTLLVVLAVVVGLIGASIRARALGWGGGGVLWLTALYGVLLVLISLILGGWIQPTESMIRTFNLFN